jgi:peptidoglycan/LPS O-acetylase OafA/YrhL
VLWSLVCEEIYYALYPLMLWSRQRFGWAWLPVAAYAASFAVTLTHTHRLNWLESGSIETSIAIYPVWLLGCILAEQSDALPADDGAFRYARLLLAAPGTVVPRARQIPTTHHARLSSARRMELFALAGAHPHVDALR